MRVRLPKPLHGWRAFVGEVGVIFLGVIIALTAQQAVEDWQWRSTTADATAQLDAELRDSALSSYQGLAAAPCLDGQLNRLDQALAQARQTGRLKPTPAFTPPLHRFSEDSWLNARALQIADHLTSQQVDYYTQAYFYLRDLGKAVPQLHEEAATLRPLRFGIAHISADEIGANQRQAGRVRELLGRVELGQTLFLRLLKEDGIVPTVRQMQSIVSDTREDFGTCAATPNLDRNLTNFG